MFGHRLDEVPSVGETPQRAIGDAGASDESDWSRLQAVAETAHRYHVARVRWVDFNLHAQSPHVHVDESTVAEIVVVPHFF